MENGINLTVKLDQDLNKQVDEFCSVNAEIKKSNLVRIALREYLNKSANRQKKSA